MSNPCNSILWIYKLVLFVLSFLASGPLHSNQPVPDLANALRAAVISFSDDDQDASAPESRQSKTTGLNDRHNTNSIAEDRKYTKAQWLSDLDYMVAMMKERHPHMYANVSAGEFNKILERAKEDINRSVTDMECFFAIRRVVASLRDGHTQLDPGDQFEFNANRFPFRIDKFTDGVFITSIAKDYSAYLGARIESIDGQTVGEVLQKLADVQSGENEFYRHRGALWEATYPVAMHGLGLTKNENRIDLGLEMSDGTKTSLSLQGGSGVEGIYSDFQPHVLATEDEYVSAVSQMGSEVPLHLRELDEDYRFYWFEHLREYKTLYLQFNVIANQPGYTETFYEFTDRLWKFIDDHADEVDKLIIDLRYNPGGNGGMVRPFLHEIIRHEKIDSTGSLFVISGRRSYSAPLVFMEQLYKHTNAIFIGSPAGSAFNLFSNNATFSLPETKCVYRVATRTIDNAYSPYREYFPPQYPTPFSSADYFAGRDPSLEFVLSDPDLRSLGEITTAEGVNAAVASYRNSISKYGSNEWWDWMSPAKTFRELDSYGWNLMESELEENQETAFEVFTLITRLFPENYNTWYTIAEYYAEMKEWNKAIANFEKAIKINPEFERGHERINQIKMQIGS